MFLSEVQKVFAQNPEIEVNIFNFPKKSISPKCSSVVVAVWQSYQKNSAKSLFAFFDQSAKVMKRMFFFSKKTSKDSSGAVKLSFDKLAGNFCREYDIFFSKLVKGKEIYVLYLKKFLKTFPRTKRMPFWQPWQSVLAEKPKYSPFNELKWSKSLIFSKKVFFLKTFIWSPRHQIY